MAQQVLIRWNTNRWNWRSKKKKDDRSLGYFEKWTEQKIWHGTESCEYLMSRHVSLLWSVDYNNNQFICQQPTFSFPSQHFLEILSSLLPFIRNLAFIRRPNFCIDVWQQLICWLAWYASLSMLLIGCLSLTSTGAFVDVALCRCRCSIMFSVVVNDDGHKRGQTSRLVVRAKVQRTRNFETYLYPCSYLLGVIWFHCVKLPFRSPYSHVVWHFSYTIVPIHLTGLVHKDFPHAYSSSGSSTRSRPTAAEPTKRIEHGAVQEGSVQCRVGAVSISCLLCAI